MYRHDVILIFNIALSRADSGYIPRDLMEHGSSDRLHLISQLPFLKPRNLLTITTDPGKISLFHPQ